MSHKKDFLHIVIGDKGYSLSTKSGSASYDLDGTPTLKEGDFDNLPQKLLVTDMRSLPGAVNVSATPGLWGAKVQWDWPKEADNAWRASIRAEYENGEEVTLQGRLVNYPDCTYQVTGVPAGKNISLSVILDNGSGKRSKPVQLSTKSSDDAAQILGDFGIISNGQVFMSEAFFNGNTSYQAMEIGVSVDKRSDEHDDRLTKIISEQIRQRLYKESQPGGLLHKR